LRGQQAIGGHKELYARLTIDGLRSEVSLGIKVNPKSWDQEGGHLTDNSPQSQLINRKIDEAKVNFQKIYDLLESQHEAVSAEMVKSDYTGKKKEKKTLLEVTDFVLAKFEKKVEKKLRAKASLVKWNTTKQKLKTFLKHQYNTQDLPLNRITFAFAEDFYDYLTLEEDISANSTYKYIILNTS
jgi:hypothetical protein